MLDGPRDTAWPARFPLCLGTMRLMPTHVTGPHLYQATPVAFLTQHGKETLLRSPLENALGCQLLHTDGYDTDLLGTFTDEIGRCGSQLEAARRKATIGMELLHTSVGIGSEGAFGPDPFSGLSAWDIEVVVWLDRSRQLEVVGMAQDFAMNQQRTVHTVEALMQFAQEAGFPAHHLLVHPGGAAPGQVRKGIRDTATLQAAFVEALAASPGQGVVVANDLRAFCNPTRQAVIGRAAADLVHKLMGG